MSKPGPLSLVAALVLLAVVTAFGMKARHSEARAAAAAPTGADLPAYTSDNKLMLPANYREWVFLSSGFGMNYSNGSNSHPMFTNVFVTPEAYHSFKSTGKWPDKSLFVVEIYSPSSKGSINQGGYYQQKFAGLDVEVKDSSQKNEWTYYNFSPGDRKASGVTGSCNTCHSQHAAVEHTFVQFYPTLLEFARERHLLKPGVALP
ncbi:MAG TPA: cytochrome P460 family protein [Candidatus Angelobacter sp.]|nr:cytochrome P460 family protein [Candidatus Angelobacter sp.]